MLKHLFLAWTMLFNPVVGGTAVITQSSSLIDALYQASRKDSEKDSDPLLQKAQELIAQNADVKATDDRRRAALHWAVIGAIYAKNEKQVATYLALISQIINRGANINSEDEFGATPLDYQENSTRFELTSLLIENGARNGSGQAAPEELIKLINDLSAKSRAGDLPAIRSALDFDLPAGTQLQIRLTMRQPVDRRKNGSSVP